MRKSVIRSGVLVVLLAVLAGLGSTTAEASNRGHWRLVCSDPVPVSRLTVVNDSQRPHLYGMVVEELRSRDDGTIAITRTSRQVRLEPGETTKLVRKLLLSTEWVSVKVRVIRPHSWDPTVFQDRGPTWTCSS